MPVSLKERLAAAEAAIAHATDEFQSAAARIDDAAVAQALLSLGRAIALQSSIESEARRKDEGLPREPVARARAVFDAVTEQAKEIASVAARWGAYYAVQRAFGKDGANAHGISEDFGEMATEWLSDEFGRLLARELERGHKAAPK